MTVIEKLRVLLPHWMEHNSEHAREYRTWAELVRQADKASLAKHIEAAAEKMEDANRDLEGVFELLGGPTETSESR